MNTTTAQYTAFDKAYDWYNSSLFANDLPSCLITLQRHRLAYGYYWAERFQNRIHGNQVTDEIALNPDAFVGHADKEILSTLVHEMVHLQHQHYGTPGKRGYHNKEWARMMQCVGLMPSNTGLPGGKQTGYQMTHYIMLDGPFDRATDELLATGFQLQWQSNQHLMLPNRTSTNAKDVVKNRNKTKFSCFGCGVNAWAKPAANLWCGDCRHAMQAQI